MGIDDEFTIEVTNKLLAMTNEASLGILSPSIQQPGKKHKRKQDINVIDVDFKNKS